MTQWEDVIIPSSLLLSIYKKGPGSYRRFNSYRSWEETGSRAEAHSAAQWFSVIPGQSCHSCQPALDSTLTRRRSWPPSYLTQQWALCLLELAANNEPGTWFAHWEPFVSVLGSHWATLQPSPPPGSYLGAKISTLKKITIQMPHCPTSWQVQFWFPHIPQPHWKGPHCFLTSYQLPLVIILASWPSLHFIIYHSNICTSNSLKFFAMSPFVTLTWATLILSKSTHLLLLHTCTLQLNFSRDNCAIRLIGFTLNSRSHVSTGHSSSPALYFPPLKEPVPHLWFQARSSMHWA